MVEYIIRKHTTYTSGVMSFSVLISTLDHMPNITGCYVQGTLLKVLLFQFFHSAKLHIASLMLVICNFIYLDLMITLKDEFIFMHGEAEVIVSHANACLSMSY